MSLFGNFHDFMSGWGWVLFSIISAVFGAGFYLVNQYLKQPGHLIVFWMRVVAVMFLTPFVVTLEMPTDWRFYAAVFATVFIGTFADIRAFNASATFGGGVVSRVQPLTVWGAFIIWFFFDPSLLQEYADHPYNTAGILAALGGCVFFSMRLNKCEITRAAFTYMLPALIGYTFTNVLNKFAMDHGPLEGAVLGYMYVQSIIAIFAVGAYCIVQERKTEKGKPSGWTNRTLLAAVLLAAFAWICHMIYKNYAMAFTPNPSYQVALGLTTPVFIALFYLMAGHKEKADVKSGMGVVACAVLLALLTVRR